jgi:hypothetical protein
MSGFVVKATDQDGAVAWISPIGSHGVRTLTVREQAAVFSTIAQAEMAIARMHKSFAEYGITFEVVPG